MIAVCQSFIKDNNDKFTGMLEQRRRRDLFSAGVFAFYPAVRSIGRDTKFTVCLFFIHYVRLRISQPGLYRPA